MKSRLTALFSARLITTLGCHSQANIVSSWIFLTKNVRFTLAGHDKGVLSAQRGLKGA